jgi:uncharacterized membrane protein YdbT with pleckstrin-like domain
MSYVEKNLLPNETIARTAKIHWFNFVPALTLIVLALTFFHDPNAGAGSVFFFVIGLGLLANAAIIKSSTEFAVTNKRVIAKSGFIVRKTIELNLSKVEGLRVDQGIFGRIFNYGEVTVNGTGVGKAPFKFIAKPLELRKAVNLEFEKIEESRKAA